MKLAKEPPYPARLAGFFEQALGELGAVCERPWHDRLDVVAEGEAASLWRDDGQLHAATLHFPEPAEPGARDAATQVFPGCPLTFRLAEALLSFGNDAFRKGHANPADIAVHYGTHSKAGRFQITVSRGKRQAAAASA